MTEQTYTFTTDDQTALFYRHQPARQQGTGKKKAIVLFHRGHEHSGRLMPIANELSDVLKDDTFAYFAWDARGHGNSPGTRGDSPSIATSVSDVDAFMRHIVEQYGIALEDIAVVAQSVSAVLVSTWLHDYAPKIRAAVLVAPAFNVKLYVPLARQGLRLMQKIRGNFFVNSYVKAHYLTHDKARIESYNRDPLITKAISVRILLGLYQAGERVIADAEAITTPIQLLIAGDDKVVHTQEQHEFYNRLGSHCKERHVLAGFYHDVLGEAERAIPLAHIARFLTEQFSQSLQIVDVTKADRYGYTRQEADKLSTPLSPLSFQGLYWAALRKGLVLGGKYSKGLAIGAETGYDSGSTLDYVYQNQVNGSGFIGKLIDKNYLQAIGWRGIRQRKVHVGVAIQTAMQCLSNNKTPVHVLDIAAGHGRYVLDALNSDNVPDSIRLRDYSSVNVEAGRQLIIERELGEIAQFDEIDAYNRQNYQQLSPRPTLGIVSGLHELFPDNDLIMHSLYGFADTIEKGNYLIYTGQPWHPQLALIARCLTSHRQGQDWVMRRRTQQEMDQLVAAAGFKKIRQWIDEDGIFTVSLAQRV